jgi:hypothetical protein
MTQLQKAMKAAREVTEMFGREEQVVRAVLEAVREPGGIWFQNQEDNGLSGEDAVCIRYFIDAILNEEAA